MSFLTAAIQPRGGFYPRERLARGEKELSKGARAHCRKFLGSHCEHFLGCEWGAHLPAYFSNSKGLPHWDIVCALPQKQYGGAPAGIYFLCK